MEKMIDDFKIIETENGFRVEITGNKEAIRQMLSGFGLCDSPRTGAPANRSFCLDSDFWSKFGGWCGSWEKAKAK